MNMPGKPIPPTQKPPEPEIDPKPNKVPEIDPQPGQPDKKLPPDPQ
jgi:hypothetical protein